MLGREQLARPFCSLYVLMTLSGRFFQKSRHGRSDRHHGKIQPSQRRPRRRRLSLWRNSSGRGAFIRAARTGRCRAGVEALVADPAAARRALRHSPGGGRQQSRQAQSHSRGASHRQASLARHRLRSRGATHRSGNSRALPVPRPSHAGVVYRAGLANHSRRIWSGKTKYRICPALRRSRRTSAGRPNLQPVAHPHRDRHSWAGGAASDRRWSREDADLGHRVQARVGNS